MVMSLRGVRIKILQNHGDSGDNLGILQNHVGRSNRLKVLSFGLVLLIFSLTSCIGVADPGSELPLQIYNQTNRSLRVTVSRLWDHAPTKEAVAVDVVVEPRGMKEVEVGLATGNWVGPVRAYAEDRLVFCQNYSFRTGMSRLPAESVDIVEGQLACQ